MRRRRFLTVAGATLAAACAPRVDLPSDPGMPGSNASPDELDMISQHILSGGVPPDGIPPIERPKYVTIAEASKLWDDDDVVDALVLDGQPRAYPRWITVWHEIVNETSDGKPLSITYCPLTGSTLVFSGTLPGGRTTTFGTSGKLYNSNLVMYDRETNSMWPQLLGVAARGKLKGERLAQIAGAVTTTFGLWKKRFAGGVVLSTETGHARSYGTSPYGDYDSNKEVFFPVRARDDRFHPKEVVVGVRWNGKATAIHKRDFIAAGKERTFSVGGRRFVARHDEDLAAVLVRDEASGEPFSAYDVMWFAWYAFNPETEVLR